MRAGGGCAAALAGLLLGAAGCTPAAPDPPVQSPIPSVSSATPTETAEERTQRLAYTEAEAAYRAAVGEVNRVLARGGSANATEGMKAVAAGPYLKFQTDQVGAAKAQDFYLKGGVKVVVVRQTGYSRLEIGLRSCEDATGVAVVDRDGEVTKSGYRALVEIQVRRVGGSGKYGMGNSRR